MTFQAGCTDSTSTSTSAASCVATDAARAAKADRSGA